LVLCAAEIVSVSVVLAPKATVDVAGTSDTTLGAAGLTVIWLDGPLEKKTALRRVVDGLEGEALWEALRPAVEAALAELCATRRREGKALADDIGAHQVRLVGLTGKLLVATKPLESCSL